MDRLHDVIQIVMGWQDNRLHEFEIGKKYYTENPETKEDGLGESKYSLEDLVKRKGRTFYYLYDFSDSWEHEIVLEDNNFYSPDLYYPIECLNGEQACPPEDVGGVVGFEEFCEAIKDSGHPQHESYVEWYEGFPWYDDVFDREYVDLDKISFELMKYVRWSRNRERQWMLEPIEN